MQYETEVRQVCLCILQKSGNLFDVDTVISVADGDNSANAAAPMAADETLLPNCMKRLPKIQ